MTASALVTFALTAAFGLSQGFWAVITALIVTQGSVGGSLKAASERFVGSVFGAVYGGAVALAIPHGGALGRTAALAIAVAPLTIAAAFSAGFRIAPITAIIVLLSTTGATLGPLTYAFDRIVEIGLGCAVAIIVSLLVAPTRASLAVVGTSAQVAHLLADQLEGLASPDGERAQADLNDQVTRTRQGLNKLETQVGEAAHERRSRLAGGPDPEPLFRTLLRLRHDLVMLRRAVREQGGEEVWREHLAQPWSRAAEAGATALRSVAQALTRRRVPSDANALADAVSAYRAAIDEMHRQDPTRSLSTDIVGRMFGVGFALEQFQRDLGDLAQRASEHSIGPVDG